MAQPAAPPPPPALYSRVTAMVASALQSLITVLQTHPHEDPLEASGNSSKSKDGSHVRRTGLPETRMGLGSTESDLLVMMKNYLEVVGMVFFVWMLGYLHFSVSWILLAVFIYLFRQRQRGQSKERHRMLSEINWNEERYIKARLDELPSWVFFPDVERAEWVNRIIKQAWPYANKYLDQAIFRDLMIPMIRSTAPALSDFAFEKLDLGEIPPRIGGVKVYSDNVRDQIMMDIEVFYAGDAFVKAKLKGIVCGIKEIQFVGDLRVILSPLMNTIPLVGAVTYFFLKKPSINFKLTDAGTLVGMPGIHDLLLAQINDIVASMMVLPNRQVFPLVADLPVGHLRWSNPQGVVRVYVIGAKNLIKADISLLGKGKSDPFVRIKAQGNSEFRTKTIDNTTDPEWNEVFEFVVEQYESDSIEFEVYDEDPGKDDFIGRAQFPLNALVDKGSVDTWLVLQDVKKGSLNVKLQYFSLTTERSALDVMERENGPKFKQDKLAKALLVCFIDRCTNLPSSRKTRREPNPFCRIQVDTTEQKTATLESQTNPKFEHISQILCASPLQQKLTIHVCDARSNNEDIAFFELPIKQIFDTDTMTLDTQSYSLRSASGPLNGASIVARFSLFILSPGRANERRLTPPVSQSPSMSVSQSFDSTTNTASPGTTDPKRNPLEQVLTSTASAADHKKRSFGSGFGLQSMSPSSRSKLEAQSATERQDSLINDDPDLQTLRYGRIKLGIRYTLARQSLTVTVYACKGLTKVHEQHLPDPYVRLYLMPESKKDKRKTKSIHDTLNPVYDDFFEWPASLADIHRKRLLLSVKNNSPLFGQEQTYMGDLQIDLSNLDTEKISTAWYALQEPNTSGGGILKIKYDPNEPPQHNTQF